MSRNYQKKTFVEKVNNQTSSSLDLLSTLLLAPLGLNRNI